MIKLLWVITALLLTGCMDTNTTPAPAKTATPPLAAPTANTPALTTLREKLGPIGVMEAKENLSFEDAIALQALAAAAVNSATTPETQGELALAQWRATQLAFFAIPFDKAAEAPYAPWITALGDKVYYHELAGIWAVNPDTFWGLADQYQSAAIGDAIAWQAANSIPGGECEGDIVCVMGRSSMFEGEYLKRYPKGQYVEAALSEVNELLSYVQTEWSAQDYNTADVDLQTWQPILQALPDSPAATQARTLLATLQQQQGAKSP